MTHGPNPESPFAKEVRTGLLKKKKRLSSKFLYDAIGSDLFMQITNLDEYYPARCEEEIFTHQASTIADNLSLKTSQVIELGCGDGFKTEVLLQSLLQNWKNLTYVPIDISPDSIDIIQQRIESSLPQIKVSGFKGDYFQFLETPQDSVDGARLILFLGSNIGNFSFVEATEFLKKIHDFMGPEDTLLIGMDLKKDIHIMNRAYNDSRGITASFNFNLLERMNRELGAHFDPWSFHHHGVYNVEMGAMQSFLVSKKEQVVAIDALGLSVDFDKLEPIHIENSCKYSLRNINELAEAAGFKVINQFINI